MRRLARTLIVLSLAAIACFGGASDNGAEEETPEDARPPQRIISLIPSITETIVALGAADRLVARSDFDTDPDLAYLPTVGQGLTPSLEQLTMLQPELVVAWPDNATRSVIGQLADLGVTVYSPEVQTLADIRQTTRELGAMLGLEEKADSLLTFIDMELEATQRAVAGRERPMVFYVVWPDPVTTAGPGTYIHELILIAGGRNVFDDAPGLWPQVSLEEVVQRDPDIVLLSQAGEGPLDVERLRGSVGWRELEAVREERIFQVDANLYNRPGPGVSEAVRRLARLIHPDAFPGE
jgi:iron complex transport system substrate-binding protein